MVAELSERGGLFHPDDDHQEIAFRYAVEKINSDRTILPRSKLLAQIERISPQDSFLASKRVCHLLGVGVAAIFGPQSSHTASHVQSICDTMEHPHTAVALQVSAHSAVHALGSS
uniref:Receptor ligand binding region domain-containing protein n=1 Tax=Anopheles dirus TaxID=7168 RepID=A0A182N101_9DIPT